MLAVLAMLVGIGTMAAAAAAADAPALRRISTAPFQVAGVRFEPAERVTVRLTVDGSRFTRIVRSTRAGTFRAVFKTVFVPRCTTWTVVARGDLGSRATLRQPIFPDCAQP